MPRRLWIAALSLWPGLPQVWSGQMVLGGILSTSFAVTLNLAIIGRFLWTEALPYGWTEYSAALSGCIWLASLGYTLWWVWLCHPERHRAEIDRLYREAIESYLQGKWNEARRRLERVLTLDETDADALMQLGTLYVRTEQSTLARRAFRQCQELDGEGKWGWEIEQALKRLGDGSPA